MIFGAQKFLDWGGKVKGISINDYFTFVISVTVCLFDYAARAQGNPGYATVYTPMKGKVHPCTGTEALYRPYGP